MLFQPLNTIEELLLDFLDSLLDPLVEVRLDHAEKFIDRLLCVLTKGSSIVG